MYWLSQMATGELKFNSSVCRQDIQWGIILQKSHLKLDFDLYIRLHTKINKVFQQNIELAIHNTCRKMMSIFETKDITEFADVGL